MTLAKLYPSTDGAGAVDWASHRRKLLTSQVTNWQTDWPIVFLLALFSTLRQIHFSHFFNFFFYCFQRLELLHGLWDLYRGRGRDFSFCICIHKGSWNISNNVNSLIFNAVLNFIAQSGGFAIK